ncbi:MAG: dockerin type I domain-containing protein, partial [Oscillospiraceae bacterium]|nr:dockerin type I domain-containing protein [Oscillospiraceae bacterium]
MNKISKSIYKRIVSVVTCIALLITTTMNDAFFVKAENLAGPGNLYNVTEVNDNERIYHGTNYDVKYRITSSQSNRQTVDVTITNKGTDSISNWALYYVLGIDDVKTQIEGMYNAKIIEDKYFPYVTHDDNSTGDIHPSSSVNFGYTLTGISEKYFPASLDMLQNQIAKVDGFNVTLSDVSDNWNSFSAKINIENKTSLLINKPELTIETNFKLSSNWNYQIEELNTNYYKLISKSDSPLKIAPNSTLSLQVNGEKEGENWSISTPKLISVSMTELKTDLDEYLERDTDGDNLPDYDENVAGFDRYTPDTDADGINDFKQFMASSKAAAEETPKEETPKEETVYGDINNDGLINVIDLTLLKFILLYESENNQDNKIADVNGNGQVNGVDYADLSAYVHGQTNTFLAYLKDDFYKVDEISFKARELATKYKTEEDDIETKYKNKEDYIEAVKSYIENDIEFEYYYGMKKGANQTLKQKSGNDVDKACLAIELFNSYNTIITESSNELSNSYEDISNEFSVEKITIT